MIYQFCFNQFKLNPITLPKSGGNQLVFGSVCESKNIKISPFATRAPAKRAKIRPDRFGNRINLTFGKYFEIKLSSGVLTLSRLLASSTKIISTISSDGERFKTLYTVRSNVLKCSLKNGTTTLTVGNSLKYLIFAQLPNKRVETLGHFFFFFFFDLSFIDNK